MEKTKRLSNIELLKILALYLITIQHCLSSSNYPIGSSSLDPFVVIGNCIRYFGHLGNIIFIVCSAYFLVESKHCNKKKILLLSSDAFVISLLWFIPIAIMEIKLPNLIILSEIFPISHNNNWFISCYLLIYLIHPFLNDFIHKLNKKQFFRCIFILYILYCIIQFIVKDAFFMCYPIFFILIYIFTAYMKYNMKEYSKNTFLNIIILISSIILYFGLTLSRNYLGLVNNDIKNTSLYYCNNMGNPFAIGIVFSLFNLFNSKDFHSKIINKISSLSLLYYLIHENILYRSYVRTKNWVSLLKFYENPFVTLLVLVSIVFISGLLIALIYSYTIQKIVYWIINKIYPFMNKIYLRIENRLYNKITLDNQ